MSRSIPEIPKSHLDQSKFIDENLSDYLKHIKMIESKVKEISDKDDVNPPSKIGERNALVFQIGQSEPFIRSLIDFRNRQISEFEINFRSFWDMDLVKFQAIPDDKYKAMRENYEAKTTRIVGIVNWLGRKIETCLKHYEDLLEDLRVLVGAEKFETMEKKAIRDERRKKEKEEREAVKKERDAKRREVDEKTIKEKEERDARIKKEREDADAQIKKEKEEREQREKDEKEMLEELKRKKAEIAERRKLAQELRGPHKKKHH